MNQLGRQSAILVALFAGMIPFSSGASLRAQDVVHIAAGETGKGRTKITCTVLDYTGQSLTLELPGGVQRVFPAERVVQIETTRSKQQTDADKLYERRQYQPALTQYRQALEAEERRWVRREILAQMVWCYRGQGDVASAAQTFLLLVQSDPKTPHFDCIPLAWLPGEPSPQAAQLARQWVDRKDLPAAVLLGASLLIGTADRTLALERLNSLAFDTDARIGWLARAQIWRANFGTASDAEVDAWAADIEKIPEPLRAGPYYVAGKALSARRRPQQAAIALMRVPILYPREQELSARSMLEAARELEKLGQKAEAQSLYREIVDKHSGTPAATEAKGRLSRLL